MKRYTSLGKLIKDYRLYSEISQSDLASFLDVDIRTVIRWEKNESLLNNEKEESLAEITFIPRQVIRNLNSTSPIPTFYDFDLRKYSLSKLFSELPDAQWIRSRMEMKTDRLKIIHSKKNFSPIIRFTKLQRNPLKTIDINLMWEASKLLPELNMILFDHFGNYSGHCIYFPLSTETYIKIRNKEIKENQLESKHLIKYTSVQNPVFYCHSITADCNENFFYIIGAVLKFFRDLPINNYLYALLTSRYDSHKMSTQLGVHTVWEDFEIKKKHNLVDAPRLVEGSFHNFFMSE